MRLPGMICLLLIAALLAGDGRTSDRPVICVGYASESLEHLLEKGACSDMGGQKFAVRIYVYGTQEVMLKALAQSELHVALLEDERLVFDNEISNLKMILELCAENGETVLLCTSEEMLEEKLEILLNFVDIFVEIAKEGAELCPLQADEWLESWQLRGYEADEILKYVALDFPAEALER